METIENKFTERDYEVTMRFPEFTCLCPLTGQPDFAEIMIEYMPGEHLVELKSLKFYLNAYRDRGIFHEEAVNGIMRDFVEIVRPKRAVITGHFNVRGGIYTTVVVTFP